MLIELRVHNLAVVAEARLSLAPGLNVLSGSTGAGKSLVVEAMRWLCGERIDHTLLRQGASSAHAEAIFDLGDRSDLREALAALGVEIADDQLLRVRREIRPGGRSRALLGASLSTSAVLGAVMRLLVGLESQHRQLALLDASRHVELLDACGVAPGLREDYQDALERYQELAERIAHWRARRQQLLEQRELLDYQRRELEEHRLVEGEFEALKERVERLSGGAKLMQALARAYEALAGDEGGALASLARAQVALQHSASELEIVREGVEQLASAESLLEECARSLQSLLDGEESDPEVLDRLQERLHALQGLSRKYGRDEAGLIALRDRLAAELGELEFDGDLPAELAAQWQRDSSELGTRAQALLRARRRVARRIARESPALLEELGMPGAGFEFELQLRGGRGSAVRVEGEEVQPTHGGVERVRLLARTNQGGTLQPVERAASGGELSRIGLVLRELSLRESRPLLLILDEIDSGLGADLGPAVARRLSSLARGAQLLVISHLPAVAAAAERHFVVHKEIESESVLSDLRAVEGEDRERELARMLGGGGAREQSLARELLARAKEASA